MDYAQIKDLIQTIHDSNIQEFELQMDNAVVRINKTGAARPAQLPASAPEHWEQPARAENEPFIVLPEEKPVVLEGNVVKAPLVGAFYAKPSPDAHPFKTVGMSVSKGDVLCIIEAMKVMNEITSPFDGVLLEALVENGATVEYNQPLFRIG